MEIKSRHHLRADAVDDITSTMEAHFGIDLPDASYEVVEFEDEPFEVVIIDGTPAVFYVEGEPCVTVRGANEFDPSRHLVTVDAGAVAFVSDGADIMRPGIVEADPSIEAGDLVVIVEETHGKALAIGRARVKGEDLVGDQGKVIDSIHHVGDELYELSI